jgi:hypothetical protein
VCLEIPERIDFWAGEIPNSIVRRKPFEREEFRQPVVFVGKTGIQIELMLRL